MKSSSSSGPTIHRVLILGHSGFIGSRLEKYFSENKPKVEVAGLSVDAGADAVDLVDPDSSKRLTGYLNPQTAVIMLAAIKRQLGDTRENFLQNMAMTANLCKLVQDHPVGRFIYFSSTAVYGEDIHNTQITEETPVSPTSYYGIAKFTSECLYRKAFEKQNPNPLLILRPATVYGPGETGYAYSPSGFLKSFMDKKPITLWGDGGELREFVFIDDLIRLVHRLTFHSHSSVLNVVAGKSYTFRQCLDITARLVPGGMVQSKPRSKAQVDNAFSNAALTALFPDFSFTPLEDGLRGMFDFLIQGQKRR